MRLTQSYFCTSKGSSFRYLNSELQRLNFTSLFRQNLKSLSPYEGLTLVWYFDKDVNPFLLYILCLSFWVRLWLNPLTSPIEWGSLPSPTLTLAFPLLFPLPPNTQVANTLKAGLEKTSRHQVSVLSTCYCLFFSFTQRQKLFLMITGDVSFSAKSNQT